MPAEHDLDPDAMTEAERLAKRRYEAYFAFETQPDVCQCDFNFTCRHCLKRAADRIDISVVFRT